MLRVRARLDGRIGKQNVIHRLTLRAVGRDGVSGKKFAKARIQDAAIGEFHSAIRTNRLHRDEFAIRDAAYRSIFDLVRDFLKDEAFNQQDKTLRKYLKPDLVIIDDMGLENSCPNTPANTCWKSSCAVTKTAPPS